MKYTFPVVMNADPGRPLATIPGSNPARSLQVCRECCVLSGRGRCDRSITRPEESYRVWCVCVWSWSLLNGEALAHQGLSSHGRKLWAIKLLVAWSQVSTLTSKWTHEQSTLTNGLNSTSLLDYKLNLIYKFIVIDVRKKRVALSCRPCILNDILITYCDCKV